MEPLRHYDNPLFKAVIFRRTSPMITMSGGLWDEAASMYAPFGTESVTQPKHRHTFPSGMTVTFSHMQHEKDKLNWQGGQFSLAAFDELTHFTESQFFYIISRLRSMSGVPGYVRASCNPDADSWVRELIDWWIGEDGYAIPERSGVVRYMARAGDDLIWGDTREELHDQGFEPDTIKSFTFIPSTVYDNQILLEKDPAYLSNLKILPKMERERLLGGNWDIKAGGTVLKAQWFEIVDKVPEDMNEVRFWDLAGTDPEKAKAKRNKKSDPDYTAGVRIGEKDGIFYIVDCQAFRKSPMDVEAEVLHTASVDGQFFPVRMWQDPAQAGVAQIDNYSRKVLVGYDFQGVTIPGRLDQIIGPFASAVERGCVKLLRGPWNRAYLNEMEGLWEGHDDRLAATLGGFLQLTLDWDPVTVHYSGKGGIDAPDMNRDYHELVDDDRFWD